MIIKVKNIFCGKVETIDDGKRKPYQTSYKKKIVDSECFINKLGFEIDTQGDKSHHGGENKAVCVYSQKYYDFFKEKHGIELPQCAFGENLSILDFDDSDICLGDKFSYGEVVFEVAQPRQPCWKISSILGIKNFTALTVKEAKTGFYFRVIKEGKVSPSDTLQLISRRYPKLTIEFINKAAFDAKNNQENIKEILTCKELAEAYRISLTRRYKNKESGVQDWQEDSYNVFIS